MPKTGSTLLFELTKAIVEACGNAQDLLPLSVQAGHAVNFTDHLDENVLSQYQQAAADRILVLKTHSSPTPYVKSEYEAGRIDLTIAIRDPRDVALSLIDHGERSRAKGYRPFSEIHGLFDAAKQLAGRTTESMRWIGIARDRVYKYEDFSADLEGTVSRIARQLRIDVAPVDILPRMKGRFTQLNKGIPGRHRDELGSDQQILVAFASAGIFRDYYLLRPDGGSSR